MPKPNDLAKEIEIIRARLLTLAARVDGKLLPADPESIRTMLEMIGDDIGSLTNGQRERLSDTACEAR